MRTTIALMLAVLAGSAAPLRAQPAEASPAPASSEAVAAVLDTGTSEWMVTAGPAWGVQMFHSSTGHDYVLPAVSWGRILTAPHGPGPLRGRFQWSLEVVPLFGQWAPYKTYGVGVSPLAWRWNFEPRGGMAPFAELAGGLLWTRDPVPEGLASGNFTAHAGLGVRYFVRPAQALVVGYRLHHISNGNRLERNPGVNAHSLQVGWSLVRPR